MRISKLMKKLEKDPTLKFRRCYPGASTQWWQIEAGGRGSNVWLSVTDLQADDWEIKPELQTFGEILYESFVGTREDEFNPWEKLSVKGDYERAAQAVLAAAKEREEADRA